MRSGRIFGAPRRASPLPGDDGELVAMFDWCGIDAVTVIIHHFQTL